MSRRSVVWLAVIAGSWLGCAKGGEKKDPVVLLDPVMLRVERFGQGTVTAAGTALQCGEACTLRAERGTVVTLDAVPAANWSLHHWSGCDAATARTCTVTLSSDRSVLPTFSSGEPAVRDGVVVLTPETLASIHTQAGSTWVFDGSAAQAQALKPGDVITSQAGNGFARRVTDVTSLPGGGPVFVETADTSLEDLFQGGTLLYSKALTAADIAFEEPLWKGSRLTSARPLEGGISLTLEGTWDRDGLEETTEDRIQLAGEVELAITPDFAVSFGVLGLEEFKAAVRVENTNTLTLSAGADFDLLDKELLVHRIRFTPVVIGPVVLVPDLEIRVKVSANLALEVSGAATFTQTAIAGARYLRSTGWRPIGSYERTFSGPTATVTGSAALEAAIGASCGIKVYGVAGPFVLVEPYLSLEGSAVASTSEHYLEWSLALGATSHFGGEVKVLSWLLAGYEVTLFEWEHELLGGRSGVYSDSTPPERPVGVTAQRTSNSSVSLAWAPAQDDIAVKEYIVLKDAAEHGRTPVPGYRDLDATAARDWCYAVIAVDSSGNRSAQSETTCLDASVAIDRDPPAPPSGLVPQALSSSAIDLSWSASSDPAGITGYRVLRGGFPVGYSTAPSFRDLGLDPGATYCYRVTAVDGLGNESAPGDEACGQTATVGAWDVLMKCIGQDYALENNLDLDETLASLIQVTGDGLDYDGTPLAYVLMGEYDAGAGRLDGRLTLSGTVGCLRVDEFSADLSTGDSGDVPMSQVQRCGCDAAIRFVKSGVPMNYRVGQQGTSDAARRFLEP